MRLVKFSELRPNDKIRHHNGTAYLIVRVEVRDPLNLVWARYRLGPIGRFRKEVVQITPAHVRGFRRFNPRPSIYNAEYARAYYGSKPASHHPRPAAGA